MAQMSHFAPVNFLTTGDGISTDDISELCTNYGLDENQVAAELHDFKEIFRSCQQDGLCLSLPEDDMESEMKWSQSEKEKLLHISCENSSGRTIVTSLKTKGSQ
jgi:hypothetical protein